MALVNFSQSDIEIEVGPGATLLQAARSAGLMVESPCSGAGTCGKCAVQVCADSLPNLRLGGRHRLPAEQAAHGYVLACEAVVTGDVTVRAVPVRRHDTLQIIGTGAGRRVALDPFVTKSYSLEDGLTRIHAGDLVLGVEPGDTRLALCGVVVDIGTTTLSASLIDLSTGAVLASEGSLNPQALQGQDVLSRIRLASDPEGLRSLHDMLLEEVGRLVELLAHRAHTDPFSVYEVVFSGNTCMLHLAVKEDPAPLGKYPYTSRLAGNEHRAALGFNLPVAPCARVYLPPLISAYVGADLVCGIMATALHREPGVTLLVDIGTNGEMILACRGRLYATSTAAGPAFEGMNISCGMRANSGAIEAFAIASDGAVVLKTIDDAEAVGICGSGLMDIAAALVRSGVIGANGRFCAPDNPQFPEALGNRLERVDGKPVFRVSAKVTVTQKDIRQVQLAKGAIRSVVEFLLRNLGVGAGEVDRVLIAGSFGYHLRPESLLAIGLLPREFSGKIEFVGNTSQSGGEALLLNRQAREEMAAVVGGIEVVELANHPDFDRLFVECLGF
jgi:uncharacterized 2Fe-2S/4Fe-4S cluster protein (DUF4445 family)